MPVGWETHSHPEMNKKTKSPQDVINKQVLKDCDVLIGIFWARIGTPTKKHKSGTIEEIYEFLEEGNQQKYIFQKKN